MKFNALTKHLSASAIILVLAVSCGGTPEKEDVDDVAVSTGELNDTSAVDTSAADAEKAAADAKAKAAAEDAISTASSTLSDAKKQHAEWRDTGKLIKAAKKALAAGDYAKAKSLADQATAQNEIAVFQAGIEAGKFEPTTSFDAPAETKATNTSTLVTNHTVVKGDSLWGISSSDNVYADPYKWPLIYKENASKIDDPDLIFPGQEFDINQNVLSSETEAAISHARNRGAWTIGGKEASDAEYLAK